MACFYHIVVFTLVTLINIVRSVSDPIFRITKVVPLNLVSN